MRRSPVWRDRRYQQLRVVAYAVPHPMDLSVAHSASPTTDATAIARHAQRPDNYNRWTVQGCNTPRATRLCKPDLVVRHPCHGAVVSVAVLEFVQAEVRAIELVLGELTVAERAGLVGLLIADADERVPRDGSCVDVVAFVTFGRVAVSGGAVTNPVRPVRRITTR